MICGLVRLDMWSFHTKSGGAISALVMFEMKGRDVFLLTSLDR